MSLLAVLESQRCRQLIGLRVTSSSSACTLGNQSSAEVRAWARQTQTVCVHLYMGGYQIMVPFWGPFKTRCRIVRDHNIDNHPYDTLTAQLPTQWRL